MQYFGENGLIKKAQQAKDMYEQSVTTEKEAMNQLLAEYENAMVEPERPTMPDNWDSSKVNAVESEDGVIVPVPKGYTASTINGEKRVSTGFVIKEGADGSATEGINEFVWVPVSDITDLYDSANNAGQLWNFSGTTSSKIAYPTPQNSGDREPDTIDTDVSGSGDVSGSECLQQAGLSADETADDFKTQLQNEFNAMKNSVEKYGGFYIGRYETGNLSGEEAVVQKNNTDIGNQTWYTQYRLSKTVGANDNVVSSMIWGCQWDATLRWMQTSSDPGVVKYVTNSTGKGYYSGANGNVSIPTGSEESYSVNNIYDMAGNVFDLTLTASSSYGREARGGVARYGLNSDRSAGEITILWPCVANPEYGSRLSLCLST